MKITGKGRRGAAYALDADKLDTIMREQGITGRGLSRKMYQYDTYIQNTRTMARLHDARFKLSTLMSIADALDVDVADIMPDKPGVN